MIFTNWNTPYTFYASNTLDVSTTAFNSYNGVNDYSILKTKNVVATQEKVFGLGPTASCGNSGDDQWMTVMVRGGDDLLFVVMTTASTRGPAAIQLLWNVVESWA